MSRRAVDRDGSPFLAGLKLVLMVVLVGAAAAAGIVGVSYAILRALVGRHAR